MGYGAQPATSGRFLVNFQFLTRGPLLLLVLVLTLFPARAHEAPSGWTYPIECCDDRDCEPIDTADVTVGDGYYVWRHHRIAFDSPSVRNSPDSFFHGCEAGHWGDEGGKKILTCFFVPLGL